MTSVIITTSEYAVLSTLSDLVGKSLTPEVRDVLKSTIAESRRRLDIEILLSNHNIQLIIPAVVCPLTTISPPPEEEMDVYINALERGFGGEVIYGHYAPMANVGYLRAATGRVSNPHDQHRYLEALRNVLDSVDINVDEETALEVTRYINGMTLAICAESVSIREGILDTLLS